MTRTVHVDLGDRSYDVEIGRGLIGSAGDRILSQFGKRRVAIITDETVAGLHLPALEDSLRAAGLTSTSLALPAGEATKSWDHLGQAVEWLLAQKIERKDLVIAFGGGVIGDLVGFASAILRRGVRFIQIPTTLLAQVDSSVGGKTGINSPQGKNLIGAFYQPALVLADIDVLDTLTPRDFWAGYGEVAKYGLLGDETFFAWLEKNGSKLSQDSDLRAEAVRHSVAMKAGIVQRDETEQGERALLNLGHTFGHVLESATGYSSRLLHGEGVAIGCALAFDLSARMGLCSQETPSRVAVHLKEVGLPTRIADIPGDLPDNDALIALMAQDKKVQDGKLRFILARGIGDAFVTDEVSRDALDAVLAQSRA